MRGELFTLCGSCGWPWTRQIPRLTVAMLLFPVHHISTCLPCGLRTPGRSNRSGCFHFLAATGSTLVGSIADEIKK